MTYIVNNTRGQILAVVQDGTVNTTATSQTLVGKNVTPYGEYEVENLVHQLENFANSTAPNNPIEGQLWYNTSDTKTYAFTGAEWKPVSGLTVSNTAPSLSPELGDIWFNSSNQQVSIYSIVPTGFGWVPISTVPTAASAPTGSVAGQLYFNTASNQLFAYNGTAWYLVGAEGIAGFATTRWVSTSLPDVSSIAHAVILGTVNGTVVSIISSDTFTILASQRPTGFVSVVPGINMSSTAVLSGRATQADSLTTARTINGVAFDGTANITIGNNGDLTAGAYLTGGPYTGTTNVTFDVNAASSIVPSTIVARDSNGNFAANVVTASLIGSVTGTATNVSGVVTPSHGGTGFTSYTDGEILYGSGNSLAKTTIAGSGPISVTSNGSGITIGYTGGDGVGNVTSVGIQTPSVGLSITGSPITSSGIISITNTGVVQLNAGTGIGVNQTNGNVTVNNSGVVNALAGTGIGVSSANGNVTFTNTGVTSLVAGPNINISSSNGAVTISATGGSGGGGTTGGVRQIVAGTGLTGGTITSTGTIAVDSTVIRSNVAQTISAVKTFTSGIVSQQYTLSASNASSIFWVGPTTGSQLNQVQIQVNDAYPHYFFQTKMVVQGNADALVVGDTYAGAVVGVDNGVSGGAGVMGWHTGAVPGLGVGTSARASNMGFTGAVFQGSTARAKSESFVQIRSYSGNDAVFQVTGGGNVTADGTYTSPAADYAEYFEWADGNPNNEDRVGSTVALQGNQIRLAQSGDTVIGVVSATPAVIGDAAELNWNNKYLQDEFGRELRESYFHWEWKDEKEQIQSVASYEHGKEIPGHAVKKTTDGHGHALTRPVLNPAYDPSVEYTPRSQRKEWAPIGLVGKLRVRVGQPTAPNWIKLRDINQNVQEWLIK
jgi:hypothetical protein